MQGTCPRTLAIFRETWQYKQRWQGYGTGLPGEPGFEHASFAHLEAEAVAAFLLFFFAFFLLI